MPTKQLANKKVLVLNKGWQAVGIVSMRRAAALLWSFNAGTNVPKAKIIDPVDYQQYTWDDWSKMKPKEGEDTLVSSRAVHRAPLVILLTKFDKLPRNKVKFNRKALWRRDDYQCKYCGCRNGEMSVDHIVPKSKGGKSSWENCCLACLKCNVKKSNKTLQDAHMKFFDPNYKPTKPKHNFFKNDLVRCATWREFVSEAYWNVELDQS